MLRRQMLPNSISTSQISCFLPVCRKNRHSNRPLLSSSALQGVGQDHWSEVEMMPTEATRIQDA
jgi:hypothetical protein